MVKISAQVLGQVIGNSETLYPPPKRQRFHHPQNNTGARMLPESQQIHPPSWSGKSKFRTRRWPQNPTGSPPTHHHAWWGLIWATPSPANHTPHKENEKALWKIQSLLQIIFCFPSFFIFTGFIDIHDFFTDVLVDFGESLCNFSFIHSFLCYSVVQTL